MNTAEPLSLPSNIMNSLFLRACRGERTERPPIWLMRQAGRYMPSYRAIRAKYTMLELCQNPEAVCEVTHLPIDEFGFDTAILFSDITIPFLGLNIDFDIKPGVGPVIDNPIRNLADIEKLQTFKTEERLDFIPKAVKLLAESLDVPLIGFAGAPFTLAAYMIEGKPSRDFKKVREFMYTQPESWDKLMTLLVDVTIDYLTAQARAGASVLKVFDSWVGGLHPSIYEHYLFSHMKRLFTELSALNVPLIHFGTGTAMLLPIMKEAGGNVIGVDWKTPMSYASSVLGEDVAIQGNLDPSVLLAPFDIVATEVDRILTEVGDRPGYIFNLGHGILPETPEKNVKRLVAHIKGA